jgi:hypothetical protein
MPTMDAQWSHEELESMFRRHEETVANAAATGDWEPFVQLFEADATYIDPIVGIMHGQDEIRTWVEATLATFPGSAMHFPAAWHLVDVNHGRIVCELRNVLRDPGDGTLFEENNISILTYAGDDKLSGERDIYDSPAFVRLIENWGRSSAGCETLTTAEREWFTQTMPAALQ